MIRLGLIGCGAWGKNYISAAEESGVAKVTHTWRRDVGWDDHDRKTIDAYIVATPPEPRAEIIIELARRGMPMMVEKPLCLSLKEALAIKEALKPDAPFLVDYVHLFAPAYEELRDRVGMLTGSVRAYGRAANATKRSYDLLWDHAPHDLAMCLGLGAGEVTTVAARTKHSGMEMDVAFSDDVDAYVAASYGQPRREFSVVCAGHGFGYNGLDGSLVVDGTIQRLAVEKPLTRAVRAFAEAIRTGVTDWRFGVDSSIEITRILEQAHASN